MGEELLEAYWNKQKFGCEKQELGCEKQEYIYLHIEENIYVYIYTRATAREQKL